MGSPGRTSKGDRVDALAKVPENAGAIMEGVRAQTGLDGTDFYALVLCRSFGLPDPAWLPKQLKLPVVDQQLDMLATLLHDDEQPATDQPVTADTSEDTTPRRAPAVPAILHPDFAATRKRRGDNRTMTEKRGA